MRFIAFSTTADTLGAAYVKTVLNMPLLLASSRIYLAGFQTLDL
jgi:hypothetical protein